MRIIFPLVLACSVTLTGCNEDGTPADPELLTTIADAFAVGDSFATSFAPTLPRAACKPVVILGGAFGSVSEVLDGAAELAPVLPGFSVDLNVCPDAPSDTGADTGATPEPLPVEDISTIITGASALVIDVLEFAIPEDACAEYVWTTAALRWGTGVALASLDEVGNDSGTITIDGVAVDLSSCTAE